MGGLDLEIGLDEDGHPLNVLDYIKYKFACAHPFVVQDESEITGSKRVQYYISDTRKELAEASANLVIRKDAYNEALSAEALRRVGNSILDGDITLGNSMEEAVLFLKDKANSNVLTAVKAKLKAFA
jgi:hypothetical protein